MTISRNCENIYSQQEASPRPRFEDEETIVEAFAEYGEVWIKSTRLKGNWRSSYLNRRLFRETILVPVILRKNQTGVSQDAEANYTREYA